MAEIDIESPGSSLSRLQDAISDLVVLSPTGASTERSLADHLADTVNIADFGGVADDTTNVVTAISAAVTAGAKTIVFDEGSSPYLWGSTLSLANGIRLVAGKGRPTIRPTMPSSSRMILMPGVSGCVLEGFTVDGGDLSTRGDALIVISSSANKCVVRGNNFIDCPAGGTGCIVMSSASYDNEVSDNYFEGTYSTIIGVSAGFDNRILSNRMVGNSEAGSPGFAIRIGEASYKNLVQGNYVRNNGIEAIGVYHDCYLNRIIGNHCEGCGDNGISITGYYNTISANVCNDNDNAGVGIWGSFNVVNANICIRNGKSQPAPLWAQGVAKTTGDRVYNGGGLYEATSSGTTGADAPDHFSGTETDGGVSWLYVSFSSYWSGVWIATGFGGTGQYNTVTGNVCDDDQEIGSQYFGIRIGGNGGYTSWAQGQSVTTNAWRKSGLNIYQATSSGTTGSTQPTHTSGTVSDGGVSWRYVRSFISSDAPRGNMIMGNVPGRSKTGLPTSDAANWIANSLVSHQTIHMGVAKLLGGLSFPFAESFSNDSAAASGGISVGQWYRRTDGTIAERLS